MSNIKNAQTPSSGGDHGKIFPYEKTTTQGPKQKTTTDVVEFTSAEFNMRKSSVAGEQTVEDNTNINSTSKGKREYVLTDSDDTTSSESNSSRSSTATCKATHNKISRSGGDSSSKSKTAGETGGSAEVVQTKTCFKCLTEDNLK